MYYYVLEELVLDQGSILNARAVYSQFYSGHTIENGPAQTPFTEVFIKTPQIGDAWEYNGNIIADLIVNNIITTVLDGNTRIEVCYGEGYVANPYHKKLGYLPSISEDRPKKLKIINGISLLELEEI